MAITTRTKLIIPQAFLYLLLLLGNEPAEAQFYVAKTGYDTHPCTSWLAPCQTINGAVAKAPGGSLGVDISVGAGTYNETVNLFYCRAARIRGNCNNLSAVQIPTSGIGIIAQDHAIGIIQCLTISALAEGATGIASRQWSIVDADRIRFSGFPKGGDFSAFEASKLSCVWGANGEPIVLTGSGASTFGAASGGSHLYLNCPVSFEGETGQTYSYFVQCMELSVCKTNNISYAVFCLKKKQ